ncbi:MAG: response regulator [Elusimicrobiota bacterium]
MSKVMIVEDNYVTVKLLRFLLEKQKFQVVSCENGKEALDCVENEKPDLILMDVMMPEIDGIEVTRRMKQNPNTSKIPIIILSALGQEMEVMRGLQAGADGYVVKPFDSQALIKLVKERLL